MHMKGKRWKTAWLGAAMGLSICACQDIEPAGSYPESENVLEEGRPAPETGPKLVSEVPDPSLTKAAPGAEPDLVLMTFNIRYSNSSDGANIWTNRRGQVYALIKARNPDVAGLQEALNTQMTDLKGELTGYSIIGVGRDDGKTAGEFSPIFYRTARFTADTSGTFWYSDTPAVPGSKTWGNTLPRICTWARLVDRQTGRGFYFFNHHIDHLSQPSREKSVQLLVQRIGEVKHAGEPVFVTGDFNVGEADPVILFMKGKATLAGKANPIPFLDSYREVHPDETHINTRHDFTGAIDGEKIDYVFMLPRMKALNAEIHHDNVGGLYPSDHFPVSAAITVPDWASSSIRSPF